MAPSREPAARGRFASHRSTYARCITASRDSPSGSVCSPRSQRASAFSASAIVGRVLDDVAAGDEVERLVLPRQRLDDALVDVGMPAFARDLDGVGVVVEAGDLAVGGQLVEQPAGAAAGVEHPGARLDLETG